MKRCRRIREILLRSMTALRTYLNNETLPRSGGANEPRQSGGPGQLCCKHTLVRTSGKSFSPPTSTISNGCGMIVQTTHASGPRPFGVVNQLGRCRLRQGNQGCLYTTPSDTRSNTIGKGGSNRSDESANDAKEKTGQTYMPPSTNSNPETTKTEHKTHNNNNQPTCLPAYACSPPSASTAPAWPCPWNRSGG